MRHAICPDVGTCAVCRIFIVKLSCATALGTVTLARCVTRNSTPVFCSRFWNSVIRDRLSSATALGTVFWKYPAFDNAPVFCDCFGDGEAAETFDASEAVEAAVFDAAKGERLTHVRRREVVDARHASLRVPHAWSRKRCVPSPIERYWWGRV